MTGSSPYPPGFGAQPPGSGPPPPGPSGPGYTPQQANIGPITSPKRARSGLLASGVALAVLLSAAALVVSIVTAVRGPEIPPPPETPQAEPQQLFVDDADKALCEAIGPLMKESNDVTNAFVAKGDANSPERLAAVPQFKTDTFDVTDRLQEVLNGHADPPRYLTRTLQSYIDGMLLYSENMYPDRGADPFDKATYDASVVAYGGPLATCYKLGVRW